MEIGLMNYEAVRINANLFIISISIDSIYYIDANLFYQCQSILVYQISPLYYNAKMNQHSNDN